MLRFTLRRAASMLLVLVAVSVLVFLIFNVIPNGDPAERMAGPRAGVEQIERIEQEWGFDESLPVQYLTTMRKVLTGDLVSYSTRLEVDDEILRGLPATISLAAGGAVMSLVVGVALGLLAALRAGRATDRVLAVLALLGISAPVFWVGALAAHYLGFEAGLFPNGGYVPLTEDPLGWAYHLILPWTVLSLLFIGLYSRVLRSSLLEALGEPHVLVARAKGLSERRIVLRHALRHAILPVVALWGLDFATILGGGAILTEAVFDLGGVGQYAADSIGTLDLPPVLAVTLLAAVAVVVLNAVTDMAQAALDPRVRAAA